MNKKESSGDMRGRNMRGPSRAWACRSPPVVTCVETVSAVLLNTGM